MICADRRLAVVTGASSGIGRELAHLCVLSRHDLILVAADDGVHDVARELARFGTSVISLQTELTDLEGVERLYDAIEATGRPVDALLANTGHDFSGGYLDQDVHQSLEVVRGDIAGTIYLVHLLARTMRVRGQGRLLIAGPGAAPPPGRLHSVYSGTQAFLECFCVSLSSELDGSGVSVTRCFGPGNPCALANAAFEAMIKGIPRVPVADPPAMRTPEPRAEPSRISA